MGILWALAGPGTVPGAGSVVVLGLNSRAVSTKETEYIGVSCDVVTSLLRRSKEQSSRRGNWSWRTVSWRGLELRPRWVGVQEKSLPAGGGNEWV